MTTTTRSRVYCVSCVGVLGLLLALAVAGAASDRTAPTTVPGAVLEPHNVEVVVDGVPEPVANWGGQSDLMGALLDTARTYQQDGHLEDALSLCRQVLNSAPDRPDALELSVELLISLSARAQQSQDFDRACGNVIEAQHLVDRTRQYFEQETPNPQAAEAVTAIGRTNEVVADRWIALREPLRAYIWDHLVSADQMGKDASPWYWSNDVDKLSVALRHLRDVRDLLPYAEDKDIQSKYFAIYGYIRSCVPEKQWDTVQARAGMFHQK